MYIISVEPHRVVAHDDDDKETTLTSVEQFHDLVGDGNSCYFSSTMDFPREATSDPVVLKLVAEIGGYVGRHG